MNISCPKCKDVEMIWGNDWDNDDDMDSKYLIWNDMDSKYLIWSQYSCPKCETIVKVYWSEDGER
jgi:phage FluMu protein Com